MINSRSQPLSGYYLGALLFYNSKNFELYLGAVFFKICSHIFMIFEVKWE